MLPVLSNRSQLLDIFFANGTRGQLVLSGRPSGDILRPTSSNAQVSISTRDSPRLRGDDWQQRGPFLSGSCARGGSTDKNPPVPATSSKQKRARPATCRPRYGLILGGSFGAAQSCRASREAGALGHAR